MVAIKNSSTKVPGGAFPRVRAICESVRVDLPDVEGLDPELLFAWSLFSSFGSSSASACCGGVGARAKSIARKIECSETALLNAVAYLSGWQKPQVISFNWLPDSRARARAFAARHGLVESLVPAFELTLGLVGLPPHVVLERNGSYLSLSGAHDVYLLDQSQLLFLARYLAPKISASGVRAAVLETATEFGYTFPQQFADKVLLVVADERSRE